MAHRAARQASGRRRAQDHRRLAGGTGARPLVRADSAFYGHRHGRGRDPGRCRGLGHRPDGPQGQGRDRDASPTDAWTPIEYTDAVFDEHAETVGLAGRGRRDRRSPRSPHARRPSRSPGGSSCAGSRTSTRQARATARTTLFDTWRFHAFFTTTDPTVADTVAADKTHRGHAIIEQVHADLKNSALAHLPSGVFTANAAWLVLAVMAFNLTRAAATIAGPDTGQGHHRDDPPQADHRACPRRVLRAPGDPAPTRSLALADRLDRAVRPGLRTADQHRRPDPLAETARRPTRNQLAARPGRHPRPPTNTTTLSEPAGSETSDRWIEAKTAVKLDHLERSHQPQRRGISPGFARPAVAVHAAARSQARTLKSNSGHVRHHA